MGHSIQAIAMNKGMQEEWGVYVEEVVQKDDI